MPTTYSPELEVLGAIYSALSADTQLTTQSGINPATGNARTVAVFNQVSQDAPVPYVRLEVTDTLALEDEPMEYEYDPSSFTVFVQVQVFSDHEPELLRIMGRLRYLLQHKEITTSHFHGNTWFQSSVNFVDNISDPDRVFRRGSIRLRVNVSEV